MIRFDNDRLYLSFGAIIDGELQVDDKVNTDIILTDDGKLEFIERSIRTMKLDRNRGMFFAGFASGTGTAPANVQWEVLGRDNDDLSKDLNPDTETRQERSR